MEELQEDIQHQVQEEIKQPVDDTNWPKVIGYILLTPAVISVFLLIVQLMGANPLKEFESTAWTGEYGYNDGGGGYSSALPIYIAIMALAGAYLIKDNSANKETHEETK